MRKIKCLFLILLLLLTINVKAENKCEKGELTRLKEIAKKIELDYDYKLDSNNIASFSIKAVNLNKELKVMIIEDYYRGKYKEFKDNSNHTATINGFKAGEKVVVTIKAFVPNWCSGTTLLTKTIKLPYYNYFYDEDKCKGNEDFKYCKLLINSNISQKIFNTQYDLYIKSKTTNNSEVVPVSNNWKLLIIIGSIVAALGILVGITILIIRKRRKNSL